MVGFTTKRQRGRVATKEDLTAETQSSQSSKYLSIKNSLLRALSASAVSSLSRLPDADLVQVSQQVGRVLVNAVGASPFQFVLAVAA